MNSGVSIVIKKRSDGSATGVIKHTISLEELMKLPEAEREHYDAHVRMGSTNELIVVKYQEWTAMDLAPGAALVCFTKTRG
jgi:hypothetical protein